MLKAHDKIIRIPLAKNKIIPKVLHFVWFGNKFDKCITTLVSWRNYHANYCINLWIAPENLSQADLIRLQNLSRQLQIHLRNIEQETSLKLHAIIQQEVKKERYWSASDTARFAILLKEPGFYFDVGVIPEQPLPKDIISEQGFLLEIDIDDSIAKGGASIGYKIFAAAYPDHPFFYKLLTLIEKNFEFLAFNHKLEKNFYADCAKDKTLELDYYLPKKQQADYIFARIVTGSVAPVVLFDDYVYKPTTPSDGQINVENFFPFLFPYMDCLDIPIEKKGPNAAFLKSFKKSIYSQISLNMAKLIPDIPLAQKLNQTTQHIRFFTLQELDHRIHLLAKIEKATQQQETELLKTNVGGQRILWGQTQFFLLKNMNFEKQANKLQTYLNNHRPTYSI
jgi:hypothetical protein